MLEKQPDYLWLYRCENLHSGLRHKLLIKVTYNYGETVSTRPQAV